MPILVLCSVVVADYRNKEEINSISMTEACVWTICSELLYDKYYGE